MLTLIPAIDSSLCEAMYVVSELLKFFSTKYITSDTPDCKKVENGINLYINYARSTKKERETKIT